MTSAPSRAVGLHRVAAAGVGLAAFAVYLLTLYPGVGGGGDAVKFQYVGSVLGTPHPPGYPLYVVVSYLFSLLPVGSLAYRINVMSAVCGAAASMLVCLILLRLRSHVGVAVAAALGLAFDRWLWGRSVGAEVYALNAALVALILWLAVRWRETGRDRDLYLMVGAYALSLGNHLTVVSLLPALAAFVVMTRPASVSVRTVAVSAGIVLLGVAQYGFIMLRTYQGAVYLEANARTWRELYEVMRATRYADQVFAFSLSDLLTERVPQFWSMFVTELTPVGIALFVLGALSGLRRDASVIVLFAGSACGVVALTLNIGADVEGFLVAACVPAWVVAGLGLQAIWQTLSRFSKPLGAAAAATFLMVLPIWQLSRNYAVNDHHRRTFEARYLRALFARLEPKAAVVNEAYATDQLVLYKLIGEKAAGDRAIGMIPREPSEVARRAAEGYAVYAFSTARRELEMRGFSFEPVTLRDPDGPSNGAAVDMSPLPIYRLIRASSCEDLGNVGWRDITPLVASNGRLMVRIDNYRPFDATVQFFVESDPAAARPELVIAQGPARPTVASAFGTSAADRPDAAKLSAQGQGSRVDLRVNDRGDAVVSWLAWQTPPRLLWAKATVDLNNPRRAVVCSWSRADFLAGDRTAAIALGEEGDAFFGQGWMAAEPIVEGGEMRRTSEKVAEVLVPLAAPHRIRIRFHSRALGTVDPHLVTIAVNGRSLPPQRIAHVWTTFEWDAPADLWRKGLNRLTLESGDPAFPVGLALSRLSFERVD